jgi:hypothetical protein
VTPLLNPGPIVFGWIASDWTRLGVFGCLMVVVGCAALVWVGMQLRPRTNECDPLPGEIDPAFRRPDVPDDYRGVRQHRYPLHRTFPPGQATVYGQPRTPTEEILAPQRLHLPAVRRFEDVTTRQVPSHTQVLAYVADQTAVLPATSGERGR